MSLNDRVVDCFGRVDALDGEAACPAGAADPTTSKRIDTFVVVLQAETVLLAMTAWLSEGLRR